VAGDVGSGFDDEALLAALGELADGADFDGADLAPLGVVYGAGFEDRPELLARIADRWRLLGNTAEVVAGVKEPWGFAERLGHLGIPHPDIQPADGAPPPGWLIKRRGGAGGGHVGVNGGADGAAYAQRRVAGRPVSALFLSGAHGTQIVGFSEQWTAPTANQPFRFGGACCPAELSQELAAALSDAVGKVAYAFTLRGLNSADFIVADAGWWLLEINPRLGATLDIFDDGDGALFSAHIAAVQGQRPAPTRPTFRANATQIAYAADTLHVPPIDWPEWTADRPHAGERIVAGAPICTILSSAGTAHEARQLGFQRNREIHKLMGVEECRTASSRNLASA
jgi:predicted ATP-grasp superfamily ATP-dependent carboligase